MISPRWTRRRLLACALGAAAARPAAAASTLRVAALDWSLASTLIGLGVSPAGVAEQRLYGDWVRAPAIPAGVPDLGLRAAPSVETLAALKPDLIAINPLNESIKARLETIAPTFSNTTFSPERAPLARGKAVTRALAEQIGLGPQAEALITESEARIAAVRPRLRGIADRPLLPLSVVDGRHLNFYGRGSLYDDVLRAIGLRNAFAKPTSLWGSKIGGVEELASLGPADILIIAPVPLAAQLSLDRAGLWSSLLALKGARATVLPPSWAFGDCLAAARFAETLADALTSREPA